MDRRMSRRLEVWGQIWGRTPGGLRDRSTDSAASAPRAQRSTTKLAMAQAQQTATAPLARLREFVALYIRKMTSELGTCVVLTEYYSMTPEHTEAIQRRRRVLDSELRALVQQAMDEGQIAPCDPKLAVFFFMGAINNINRWFTEDGPLAGEQIAQAFADHAIACLSPIRSPGRKPGTEPG